MILRALMYFVVLAAISWVLTTQLNFPFGTTDYFEKHGLLFLIFITLFPRLTLFFSSVASGGIIWWLSWLFVPRVLVATLATFSYFQTNPILVTISWLVAFGGEGFEKRSLGRSRFIYQSVRRPREQNHTTGTIKKEDVIDVDFKRM